MRKWAFATSPVPLGLGMSSVEFWYLSHEEYSAKAECWSNHQEAHHNMVATLRSDIWNSGEMTQRADKRAWTAQDFGAEPPPEPAMSEEFQVARIRANMLMKFGAGKNSSLGKLKGQSLPVSIADKIRTG